MGVYARKHAHQQILDSALVGEKSDLSPRAQLLLLHIAQNFAGDENLKAFRDVKKGRLWNMEAVYFEGLGKKARAIGYNVPDKIDTDTVVNGDMTQAQVNAVKFQVNKAMKELVAWRFLTQVKRGQTGQTAEFHLTFLNRHCSQCVHATGWDQTKHMPQDQKGDAQYRDEAWLPGGEQTTDDGWGADHPWAKKVEGASWPKG